MSPLKIFIELLEQALKQLKIKLFGVHVCMDLLDQLVRGDGIEFFPALIEFDESIPLVEVLREESLDLFVRSLLKIVPPRLVSADQIRDASLTLIEKLGNGNSRLFASTSCANLWNLSILDHVMVAHQKLCFRPKFVRHEDASFIIFIVFKLEDEIEAGDFLFYLTIVAPANLIQVLILDKAINIALPKLCLATWEIPLAQSYGRTSGRVPILLNHILRNLNIKQRIKRLNWQESSIPRITLDLSSETLFNRLLVLACLIILLRATTLLNLSLQEVRRALLEDRA